MALLNAGADPDILDNKGRDAAMALMQRLDPHQTSHVIDLMWAELEAEGKGMTMDEFFKAHPHRKTRIDNYKPRDERLENRMLVELRKAGSFGRALRRSFEMDPKERHEYLGRVLDDQRDRFLMRMVQPIVRVLRTGGIRDRPVSLRFTCGSTINDHAIVEKRFPGTSRSSPKYHHRSCVAGCQSRPHLRLTRRERIHWHLQCRFG